MYEINWAEVALRSEVEYSKALGSVATAYADYVHLHNAALPWGGDFNCAVGVQITDYASFDRIVARVERIHEEKGLERPDRYDVHPPPLDEVTWGDHLAEKGYRLGRSVWFCAATREASLPAGVELYTPCEEAYIAWYHERQRTQAWYDEGAWQRLRPLQVGFARVFVPYWLLRDGARVGWVYCGYLGDYGSLFDVWIEPAYRGQGLGRVLMNAIRIKGRRRGIQYLLLRTSESRRGFYEKCGFEECLQSSTIRLVRESKQNVTLAV
jgi:GNAT superfamily N-acetyltransferase